MHGDPSGEEPLLGLPGVPRDMSCELCGPPCTKAAAYAPVRQLSHYDDQMADADLESKLRERYNAYPRVTFAMGMCMIMVGFQWMVQQLREERWYDRQARGGGVVDDADSPKCYVNKQCSYHKDGVGGVIPGHNTSHVLSNLVYIVAGFLASIYTCYRKMKNRRAVTADGGCKCRKGLYSSRCSGMYVNAGMSLMVEGCLSGLYHICPTRWNNQFDYVGITMVCLSLFLMLWSKRHPLIISVGTWATFFGYVIILCGLSALEARSECLILNAVVWALCILFYFLFMPRVFFMLHYGLPFIVPEQRERKKLTCKSCLDAVKAIPKPTLCFFSTMWLLGFVWFVYCLVKDVMLTSAIMKYSCLFLGVYMMFYIVMESKEYCERHACFASGRGGRQERRPSVRDIANAEGDEVPMQDMPKRREQGEPAGGYGGKDAPEAREQGAPAGGCDVKKGRCTILSRVSILAMSIATSACMFTGFYFFCHDVYKTTVSRKESESLNKPCAFGLGLDNHDLWHLCSGIALGGVIVVSLMLEDLSKDVHHDELGVF